MNNFLPSKHWSVLFIAALTTYNCSRRADIHSRILRELKETVSFCMYTGGNTPDFSEDRVVPNTYYWQQQIDPEKTNDEVSCESGL